MSSVKGKYMLIVGQANLLLYYCSYVSNDWAR